MNKNSTISKRYISFLVLAQEVVTQVIRYLVPEAARAIPPALYDLMIASVFG